MELCLLDQGKLAELFDGFEVRIAGQVADAPVQVQPELGGEGFWVGTQTVLVAALFEGDQELIGDRTAEDLPGHFQVAVGGNGHRGRHGGLGQGSTQRPAAEHVPGGNFGHPLELDQLVFGGLGKFDAIDGRVHSRQGS